MADIFLELQRLRASLHIKGHDEATIQAIVDKAEREIEMEMQEKIQGAIELLVQSGVQKKSADFINEIRPTPGAFQLETESGNTDFSEPPYPMLDKLLANAKPLKDGSGVYKVIPVGTPGTKPPIYTNIWDAQKAIAAERYETSVSQYNKVKPTGSKANFKTATSKQSRSSQWVMPAKEKDFTQDLTDVNVMLDGSARDIIERVIRSYEDEF
jgi:hypothetical protein